MKFENDQRVPHPYYYAVYMGIPMYIDNLCPYPNKVGHIEVHVLVPKKYMGHLIGKKRWNIKRLMEKY